MNFTGKTAFITGAAGNLGRAVAAAFEAAGAAVVLVDIDPVQLEKAYTPAPRRLSLAASLLDPQAVAQAADAAEHRFGRIDILCNIAGGFAMGPPVHQTPDAFWQGMMDLNVMTVLRTAHAIVPRMIAAGAGKIVNIAAIGGLSGKGEMAAYSAAKSAVIRVTEAMALELRDQGINVNCVLPSIIDTPQNRHAMPKSDPRRWVSPEALADVICYLASDAARAVHGAAVPVVGLS